MGAGLPDPEIDITGMLLFRLKPHALASKVAFDLNDSGACFHVNALPVTYRGFQRHIGKIARLKLEWSG